MLGTGGWVGAGGSPGEESFVVPSPAIVGVGSSARRRLGAGGRRSWRESRLAWSSSRPSAVGESAGMALNLLREPLELVPCLVHRRWYSVVWIGADSRGDLPACPPGMESNWWPHRDLCPSHDGCQSLQLFGRWYRRNHVRYDQEG